MRTIPAREIKRRGIGAFDAELQDGPLHVIKNDSPAYVLMTEEYYRDRTH
jgi:PHD/YefM family antitoxin component YafN of YafNO toxin-antitoxin module